MTLPTGKKIERPHRSWLLHQLRWRWLLDSWEGGEAYRLAVYGMDVRGLPVRNLIRHKREYPTQQDASWSLQSGRPAGTDMANQAYDDDYELRRSRTPVPTFLPDTIKRHLGKVYCKEIKREAPDWLIEFWRHVDGCGTEIDTWMSVTIAPLLLVLGHIDILVEHPAPPSGELVETRADEMRLKLNTLMASHILPENLPWWVLNRDGTYRECVVREVGDDGSVRYRFWNAEIWQEYHGDGQPAREGPLDYGQIRESFGPVTAKPVEHGYGCVPIIRLFDRHRPRERHCGMPRYEAIAEIQREFYNRDSEAVLADSIHAHPLIQGPSDVLQPDTQISVGPNWMLPKIKYSTGAGNAYEGFDVINFPSDGQEGIRQNKSELIDRADRAACLVKPAGAAGTHGKTVAQSGISKTLDANEAHDLLGEISHVLRRAEYRIAELATWIQDKGSRGKPINDTVKIDYPKKFDLSSAKELLDGLTEFYAVCQFAGETPEIDRAGLCQSARLLMPGLDDEQYEEFDADIDRLIEERGKRLQETNEAQKLQPVESGIGDGAGDSQEPIEVDNSAMESTVTETNSRERPDNMLGARTQ